MVQPGEPSWNGDDWDAKVAALLDHPPPVVSFTFGCPESGAHPLYKAALADPGFTQTTVTRAFSGRPARGLVNRFMLDHPGAPSAYPEINNATRPLRAAAAAAGDTGRMSLYAGEGFRAATDRPAAEVVEHLCPGV